MNLKNLQSEVSAWAALNFPNAKPHQPLVGIMEELGELSHAHLKQEQFIRGEFATHQLAKQDAVGDIIVFLAHYCHLNGMEINKCVEMAWGQVKNRDWVKNSIDGVIA